MIPTTPPPPRRSRTRSRAGREARGVAGIVVLGIWVAGLLGACAHEDRAVTTTASTTTVPPTTVPTATESDTTPSTTTARPTTTIPNTTIPNTAPTTPATTTTAPTPAPTFPEGRYPWHHDIVATTFWVGELHDPTTPDGSQVCSTYDGEWAARWSGVTLGTVPRSAPGCGGSPWGGCDGRWDETRIVCHTEARSAENGFFPRNGTIPLENPFYLDVPYDDLNDPIGFARRCEVIPWAGDDGNAGRCEDRTYSFMKNRWVEIVGPNGRTCFGQVQDAGPSSEGRYHDAAYVFGHDDRRPAHLGYGNAGMDVSPALNGCLGFRALDGAVDRVSWRFVDAPPPGPWTRIVTTSQVNW